VKEEEALRANVYFKEEQPTTKKRRSSSVLESNTVLLQQPFFGSVLPNTTFVHNPPPPLLPQPKRDMEIKLNIPKKKLDQDHRYIATLEEFIEQQNKALMQKDHLINIKDQTIEQLQRHIESLSSHWVSREIKPYTVQYSMAVPAPPAEPVTPPAAIPPPSTATVIHPQNIRYSSYQIAAEPSVVDPCIPTTANAMNYPVTKNDPSLMVVPAPDLTTIPEPGTKIGTELGTMGPIIIKNELALQPQQPPEPLNQTVNELMSE
jgi:hypothetical protein